MESKSFINFPHVATQVWRCLVRSTLILTSNHSVPLPPTQQIPHLPRETLHLERHGHHVHAQSQTAMVQHGVFDVAVDEQQLQVGAAAS